MLNLPLDLAKLVKLSLLCWPFASKEQEPATSRTVRNAGGGNLLG